jgi:ketol-acid reductoisomerase
MAYFECLHSKLIVDLIYEGESRTCAIRFQTPPRWRPDAWTPSHRRLDARAMKSLLADIQSGAFADE